MNQNKTHLTIVLDRSGSMHSIAKEMEGGLQHLIEEQKQKEGQCTLTFVRFDNEYEKVLDFVDVKNIDPKSLELAPRSMTALNDALGRAISETGETLAKMKEGDRPGLVTVVIVTDGLENASKEYSPKQIKEMIERQQNKYSWEFIYLGADQDSVLVSKDYGIKAENVANYSRNNSEKVFRNFSSKLATSRDVVTSGGKADFAYTNQDKKELND